MDHIFNLKESKLDGTERRFEHEKYFSVELPKCFDLRSKCPAVYDQGNEGSCTANAGCACRSMLSDNPSLYLSRAFQYYEERALEGTTGEDSGASMKDIGVSMQANGVCLDSDMPYVPGDYKAAPSAQAVKDAEQYRIRNSQMVSGTEGIKTALFMRNQPVLCGMTVYESMESYEVAQSGILPMPKRREQIMGGHAVLIVGYQDKETSFCKKLACLFGVPVKPCGYFIVRNSWGAQWGDGGYFYMPYEYVVKGYANEFWILNA